MKDITKYRMTKTAKEKRLAKTAENLGKLPKLNNNRIAYLALREQGYGQKEAAEKLGLSHSYGHHVEKKLGKKFTLADAGLAKRSHRVIKSILDGQPREEEKTALTREGDTVQYTAKVYPTFGNQLTAAELVQDRYDPPSIAPTPLTSVNLAVILQGAHAALKAQAVDLNPLPGNGGEEIAGG